MKMRGRSRFDILCQILTAMRDSHKYTHILLHTNLNSKVLNECLSVLLDRGLITRDGAEFYLQPKGIMLANQYAYLMHVLGFERVEDQW